MRTPAGQESLHDSPAISNDFFQGDIRRGLEQMRLRLLDLTSRNRLLNFRHTKKSSLRVVDELPDQLFGLLLDGKTVRFKAVPRPRGVRRPNSADDEWFGGDEDEPAGDAARPKYPTAKEQAAHLGINVDFELPSPSGVAGGDGRYNDRDIQTLHYPEDLEAILRSMGSAARLAIEETGTNMLYLVAGFLEWFESADSRQARLAPLLLLPVTLQREEPEVTTRTYRYALQYSGEDALTNVSLQERLRRDFGVELPELDDEDTPEGYFAKLQPLLRHDERWRVRRYMTLTLLSFGKLLMYRDLDPKNWPKGKGPAAHPRIREFFEGVQREGIAIAEEYRLDDPALRPRVPPVVDDADSSQHSALVDALEGRNLVIAGPPGTGKSQTITNLIAAALARGKRVLFVSEKLAALQVVRHRLDKLGLGAFCLELHSHKTQKRRLLDDIDARLQLHRQFRDPGALEGKLHLLEADRQALTEYVELVNQPYGRLGETLYDVIWATQRRRKGLRCDPAILEKIRVPGVQELSAQDVAGCRRTVDQYTTHLHEVLAVDQEVARHPWYGVSNAALTFMDERQLVDPLEDLLQAARVLSDLVREWNAKIGGEWLPSTPDEIRRTTDATKALPTDAGDIVRPLLPRLRDQKIQAKLKNFVQWVRRYRDTAERISALVGTVPAIGPADVNRAADLLSRAADLVPGASAVGDIADAASLADAAVQEIRAATGALQSVARWLETELLPTELGFRLATTAVEVISDCPWAELRYRHGGLEVEGATDVLTVAARDAEPLRAQRASLLKRFDLGVAPAIPELRQHLQTAANARWWSILSSRFRDMRRAYTAMVCDGKRPAREQIAKGWREVLDFALAKERFVSKHIYREVAGAHYDGLDTPWDALARVARWRAAALEALGYGGVEGRRLAAVLWGATPEQLKGLRDAEGTEQGLAAPLHLARQRVDESVPLFWPGRPRDPDQDIVLLASELACSAEGAAALSAELARLGVPATLRLGDREEFLRLLAELHSLQTLIDSATEIAEALDGGFRGAGTDLERVARTVMLYDTVMSAHVPVALRDWLLSPEVGERLPELQRARDALDVAREAYVACWSTVERVGKVVMSQWAGASDVGGAQLRDVVLRAERALASRDTLPGWLDYLRAKEAVAAAGFRDLVAFAESGALAPADLAPAFLYIVSNSMVEQAFQQHPYLARFSGLSHDQIRQRFARLDRETMELQRRRVAYLADQRPIPSGNGRGPVSTYTELHLLEREIDKQKRHIPIRQLVLRAGRALQALKPCFMMGPLSVAQYLAPAALEFDLVVMDEASQLKPEDALGAIARAQQVVVVGDRMQLPPTSFFDRIGDDEEDDSDDAAQSAQALSEAESILDVASITYKPTRMLRWHYRSRHGSLIAFSNREFYKNQLIAFPSPVAKSNALGVKLVHVRDGVYENRRNLIEARRVVATALRHMRERPNESLGIVTLNATQRELVESIFEQQLKSDPVAQRCVEGWIEGLEPFFIKNLENVQGDERDVIYISVTYGRSPSGHVYQRFGPINGPTGHRRLNVLFTRARRRVVVFASMLAEDIQAPPSSAWGVRALKGYLQFAQTGILEQASLSGREPDSDFEVEVAEALRSRGLETAAQVGVAGYYIDLAVKHPTKADTFILGIECDGKTYHSGVTARDRDRLRQSILEDLGWKIHRIWSTDWFKASSREIDRIVARVESLLAEERSTASVADPDTASAGTEELGGERAEASETEWQGEVEAQPLSEEEVRESLRQLRDEIDQALPAPDPQTGLLRDGMLDLLIRTKPRTKEDWLRKIPLDLRLDTDGPQLQGYLGRVLELMARFASTDRT